MQTNTKVMGTFQLGEATAWAVEYVLKTAIDRWATAAPNRIAEVTKLRAAFAKTSISNPEKIAEIADEMYEHMDETLSIHEDGTGEAMVVMNVLTDITMSTEALASHNLEQEINRACGAYDSVIRPRQTWQTRDHYASPTYLRRAMQALRKTELDIAA